LKKGAGGQKLLEDRWKTKEREGKGKVDRQTKGKQKYREGERDGKREKSYNMPRLGLEGERCEEI
jgi:hypothetical protein